VTHDFPEYITLEQPLGFHAAWLLQCDVGADLAELELLEDLKWTIRAWRESDFRYLDVSLMDIWNMVSDPDLYAQAMAFRPYGVLDAQEMATLNGILRLFYPMDTRDIRLNVQTLDYHGPTIGWTDRDHLQLVKVVLIAIFHARGLEPTIDTLSPTQLRLLLINETLFAELKEQEPTYATDESRDCALSFLNQLEERLAERWALT